MPKLWLALALLAWFGKEKIFVCGDAYSDTQLAIKSLEKVNEFYADSIEDQYVDGLFGLRVAQGKAVKWTFTGPPRGGGAAGATAPGPGPRQGPVERGALLFHYMLQ